jgi:hypothetical protein
MSDAVDQLAQALRNLINEAVQKAVQEAVARKRVSPPNQPMQAQRPGDPVDEEIRREYEKRFGEPAPRVWGERWLISVAEARQWLGGISPSTFYALVKGGELSLVKIGRRSFVQVEEVDNFIQRKRDDASGPRVGSETSL